jgi:protein-S-isoprenylcysteine O-methyltransferase Ste14
MRGRAAGLGTLAAGAAVVLCGLYWPTPALLPSATARPLGIFLVFAGSILLLYALAHPIERHLAGSEDFRRILRMGPYALIRQPVPAALTVAFVGSSLLRQSVPGMAAAGFLLLPMLLWRAHLAERALRARFGERWEQYAATTGFILPVVLPSRRPPGPSEER